MNIRYDSTSNIDFNSIDIEKQAEEIRNQRRREDDEARGTKFGKDVDTEVYDESSREGYLRFLSNNDEVMQQVFS